MTFLTPCGLCGETGRTKNQPSYYEKTNPKMHQMQSQGRLFPPRILGMPEMLSMGLGIKAEEEVTS
jgi:hypothetical protein